MFGQVGVYSAVLNAPFVGSALNSLAHEELPLYIVSVVGPAMLLPSARGGEGLYCIMNLRRQHRVAASLFQGDYLTCAVKECQWPHRVSLPVYVGEGCGSEVPGLVAGVMHFYGTARLQAAHQVLTGLLTAYYHYAVKCHISVLCHSCF